MVLCAATARKSVQTDRTIDFDFDRELPFSEILLKRVLAAAVLLDMKPLVYALVERGIKDYRTEYGTAFEAAIHSNDFQLVQYLLDKDVHFHQTGYTHRSAVELAARNGNKQILQLLLSSKYMDTDHSPYTCAIQGAVAGGHLAVVQDLLHTASTIGYKRPSLVRYASFKTRINPMMDHILFIACCNGQKNVVQWALDQGADPRTTKRWPMDNSAFVHSVRNGYEAIVRLLLENYEQRDLERSKKFWQRNYLNQSLVIAARRGLLVIAQLLIDHGAHVNAIPLGVNSANDIPIISAVKYGGQVEMVALLLRNGANIDNKVNDFTKEDSFKQDDSTIKEFILSFALQYGYTSIYSIINNSG